MAELIVGDFRILFDDDDAALVGHHTWHVERAGSNSAHPLLYARANIPGANPIRMHRLIMGFPPCQVDHRDTNGLNNRRSNLRLAGGELNAGNQRKRLKPTTSRYKGVTLITSSGMWQAQLGGPTNHYLGSYASEEDAARAYDAAAIERFGEFARTNFTASGGPPPERRRRGVSPSLADTVRLARSGGATQLALTEAFGLSRSTVRKILGPIPPSEYLGKYERERTHCPRNHEYTPENTAITKAGTRRCRACDRLLHKESHARRKLHDLTEPKGPQ